MSESVVAQIPIRPMPASPRTAKRPLAFTGLEFIRGLAFAYVVFNVVFLVGFLGAGVIGDLVRGDGPLFGSADMVLMPLFTLPLSGLVFVTYGWLLAFGLGKLMAREPRKWVHRAAFAGLGLASGYLSSSLILVSMTFGFAENSLTTTLLNPLHFWLAFAAGVAAWAGWEFTSKRALRADAQRSASDASI